jgi:Tfp pilus assembly PilM family ATPase
MSRTGLFVSPPPDLAVAIDASRVVAARLAWRGDAAVVSSHAVEPLPAGLVTPALTAANIADVSAVGRVIAQALARVGGRGRRAALVVPDTVAKVSLVRFDKAPAQTADLLDLVRWQIRKSAPFSLEQGVVSYTPGAMLPDGGREFVVSAARLDVIAQYEQACAHAGLHAGLVDLATFSIINAVMAAPTCPADDWLLVHATPTYTTLAVLRDRDVIFFRQREDETEGTLTDVVHQTAMYYEDRLSGAGFSQVLLADDTSTGTDTLRRNLEERLGVAVAPVASRTSGLITGATTLEAPARDALSSLVGILARERKVA